MGIDFYSAVYLITNLFSIAIIHRFMRGFFTERIVDKRLCAAAYCSYFLLTSVAYLVYDIPILTMSANLLTIILITFCYRATVQRRLISVFFIYVFMLVPEVLISALTGYFNFPIFSSGHYSNAVGVIVIRLVTYTEALLVKNVKMVKTNQNVNNTVWIASVFIPFSSIVFEMMIIDSDTVSQAKVLVSMCLVLLLNLTAFYLYDSLAAGYQQKARAAVVEKERELYYNQCAIMQQTSEELQAFRHDINNQFIAIMELIHNGRLEDVRKQVASLSDTMKTTTLYSTTGNTVVDSIINYKLQNAANDHIEVVTELAIPQEINVEIADIITVLGNLLDNALQAMRSVSEGRRLFLKMQYSCERLILQVANPYRNEVAYENGEIVTSKADKHSHGFGLKNIERVVEKYDGYMEVNHKNFVFTVDILMFPQKK